MTTVSATLGTASSPYTMDLNGKTINMGLIDQVAKSGLEKWLFQNDLQDINDAREAIGEEEYKRRLDQAFERKKAKEYAWGTPGMVKVMSTIPGIAKILSLISTNADGSPVDASEIEFALQDPQTAEELMIKFQSIFHDSMPQKKTGTKPVITSKPSRKR